MAPAPKAPWWARPVFFVANRLGWIVSYSRNQTDYHFMLVITKPRKESK